LQLPSNGGEKYFAAPNSLPQPYRLFLPGIWLTFTAEKNRLSAEVNPFASSVLSSKSFHSSTTRIDTLTTLTEVKTLNKIFGVSAAITYDYNTLNNWWVGGGVQGNWWRKGVTTIESIEEKRCSPGDPSVTKTYTKNSYTIKDSDWVYFSKFQLRTNAEVIYTSKVWHAGIRLGYSFTELALKEGPKNRTQLDIFFRLALLSNKKKKK